MFLSYARSSEEQATYAELALRDAGYVVWRDSELPAHLSYADVIEERLKSAKAVLVLWSAEAAKSQWVRAEADAARELGTLIQSSVDGTVPPIPFNQIQCASLKGWNGENDHAGWRKLLASVVALAGQVEESVKSSKQRPASSICVLPFQNQSGDAVPDHFTDGISEDITSDLKKVSALSVIPRKKAFEFKGQDVDPCSVAEQLGVGYVLEGTVRRAGDRVRITTQLIDGRTGEQAWSDRYYRDFTDVFAVQDEISQTIVEALKTKLLPVEKAAIDDAGTGSKASRAKTKTVAGEGKADGEQSAIRSELHDDAGPQPEIEVQDAQFSIADKSFGDEFAQAPLDPDAEWYPNEEWDSDEDSSPARTWRSRGFQTSELAPRLIALGLVLVLAAVLIRVFYWPDRSTPIVQQAENHSYTIIATVNVRSLPSRYNSRILGTLEKGETINIVPDLAGAQPDWLKIEDGPYIGGYVWRESTRPASDGSDPAGSNTVKDTTQRTDVTG